MTRAKESPYLFRRLTSDSLESGLLREMGYMTSWDVMVVGAGMAGLVCAQRLQLAGYQVSVLEKSKGLGGRMATRRVDGVAIDHGARFLQPQGPLLSELKQKLVEQGVLINWRPYTLQLDSTGHLTPKTYTHPYYVAPAGMSAVGKALGAGLTIYRQQRVVAIAPTADSDWQISTQQADNSETCQYTAKALVLAIPAPQITPLLEPWFSDSRVAAMGRAIATVQYAPCITVIAQYAPPTTQRFPSLPCELTEPWAIEGHAETPFFWVGLDSSKRQSSGLSIVIHSSVAFAEQWLEVPNRQDAGEKLLTQAGNLIVPWLAKPTHWQVHRWRYALVKRSCPEGILSASIPEPLVACGDWCGDRQIDTAVESGWAAAERINSLLEGNPLTAAVESLLSDRDLSC